MDPNDNSHDDITSEDLMKNKKGYHTPFFCTDIEIEWSWIVMDAFLSLLFGTSQQFLRYSYLKSIDCLSNPMLMNKLRRSLFCYWISYGCLRVS